MQRRLIAKLTRKCKNAKSHSIDEPDSWDPERVLLRWSQDAAWTVGDSYTGTICLGSTGSAKSTGTVAMMAAAMLEAGYGMLCLTVKPEDRQNYIDLARSRGRLADVMVFSPDHLLRYNFIADEMAHAASPLGLVENLTALIMTIAEVGDRGQSAASSGGEARFFDLAANQLCRNGLCVNVLSGDPVTVPTLHKLIVSAPQSLEAVQSGAWRETEFGRLLQLADRAGKTESVRADFDLVLTYFLREWPALSPRTRSVVQTTLTTVTDQLSRGAARDLLSAPAPNFSFDALDEGKVIIVDFPVLVYRDIARVIQVAAKFMAQRHLARRTGPSRPVAIVADEAQLLMVEEDQRFQAIARSTRTAVLYATQSISGLIDALGPNAEDRVHALLTNLQTQVCHQQTDPRTVRYFQELVGRSRQIMASGNQSQGEGWLAPLFGQDTGASYGFGEVYEHELQASDFNTLARGGPPRWMTEAIVYQGGRRFANGRTWLKARIRQEVPNAPR